jgi:hypothetical protein
MPFPAVVVSLPIADRRRSHAFCRECLLTVSAGGAADVDALVERARGAGAEVRSAPARQPWGYAGTFADPDGHVWMVTAELPPG